jgi:CRP-like cAMP-binding protein
MASQLPGFGATSVLGAGAQIYPPGDRQAAPRFVVSGVAAEVRDLDEGRRQIVQLRLPGEVIEPHELEAVVAVTKARTADARPFLDWLTSDAASPAVRLAWLNLREEDAHRLRDHVVRLGRMTARERVAHFLLEVHGRLARAGLVAGQTFHLPLTQETLSDVLGLSCVHVNRTLKALRRGGLIALHQGFVTLADRPGLAGLAASGRDEVGPALADRPRARVAAHA